MPNRRSTRKTPSQTTLQKFAAKTNAKKKEEKKMKDKENDKNDYENETSDVNMRSSDEEDDDDSSDDDNGEDNISNTSKKRVRDETPSKARAKKEAIDASMEIDGEITIVGFTPGGSQATSSEKKHHPEIRGNATWSVENSQQ